MAKEEKVHKQQSSMTLCLTFFQVIAFIFALVATPIAQFQTPDRGCYTLWGFRHYCGNIPYDAKGIRAFGCQERLSYMNAGAAFAVLSVITSLIGVVLVSFRYSKIVISTWYTLAMTLLTALFTMISFACVATVYNKEMCQGVETFDAKFGDVYKYTAGFALLIVVFGFEVVNSCLLIVFICKGK